LLNSNIQTLCSKATGHAAGLVLLAEDRAYPDAGMVAHVTKDYATGWMAGDCRLAAICEGAGSAGASGGELVQTPDFSSAAGWSANAGWSVSGGFANFSGATGNSINTAVAVTAGTDYTATLVVTSISGVVQVSLQGGTQVLGPAISAPGTYQIPLRAATGNNLIIIYAGGGTTVAVDSLSLRKTGTFSDVVTGSGELVGSGDGTSTTGWTTSNATPASVSGELEFTTSASGTAYGRYAISTVVGEFYCLQSLARCAAGTPGFTINAYPSDYSTSLGGVTVAGSTTTSTAITPICFRATTTTTYIQATMSATGAGQKFYLDNVWCKLATPDRSCKGKGLIVNGTLPRAPVATGSDLYSLSGFSAAAYLEQPYNPDMDVGTGDCAWAMWFNGAMSIMRAYYTGGAFSGTSVRLINTGGLIRFFVSDGTVNAQANSNTAYTAGAWHLAVGVLRRATSTAELWVDGALLASASAAGMGSLNNTSAVTRVGKEHDGSVWGEMVALPRFMAYAPNPTQIRRMYADEAALFQAGAKAFLGGTSNSVQGLALDEDTGVLSVATADGVSQFAGLRRVGRLTQAAGTSFTVPSVTSVAAGGGTLLVGTASEAGVVTELMPIKDELRQPPGPANSNDIVFEVTTTGAAPAVLGKLFVGEGESLLIDLDVQGVEYGLTPADACSYSIKGPVRRSYGGNVQIPTTPLKIILSTTNAAMDAGMSADTAAQAVSFGVTGLIGKTMVWRGVVRINRIGGVNAAA
jgi:hypothetical protein